MWSSTSENNKKSAEVEDCKCSGDSASAAAAAHTCVDNNTGQKKHQQQQQLNTFENSSKKQTTTPFGANLKPCEAAVAATADSEVDKLAEEKAFKKEKELAGAAGGCIEAASDSGFISGPQTNIFDDDNDDTTEAYAEAAAARTHKFNIAPNQPQQQQLKSQQPSLQQQKEEEKLVLDSGCIDEDFTEEIDDYDDIDIIAKKTEATLAAAAAATTSKLDEQVVEQVQNELSNKTVAGSATTTNNNSTTSTNTAIAGSIDNHQQQQQQQPQMILKENVDSGMSEWFCKLNLQNEAISQSAPQQQQQLTGINSMNNLDTAGRKLVTNLNNKQQQQQQTQSAAASATTNTATTTTNINLTPSNAWEQFYQQNDDGDTPMHLACISGYVDIVAALIRMAPHPCLFNIQNDEAQSPLHLAALTAQPKILRMLLIAGAEPTIRDRHGNTALHLACISGEEQCVRALTIPISASEINEAHRQYGHRSNDKTVSYLSCARLPSDLEIRNYDGERCVHLASQAGHIDILRILVLYGADINAREGKSGRTPLHIAIEGCNEDLANFLLDECQKLNLETATYAGLTAYQVACILNKSQFQDILEKRGAETLTPPDSDYDSSDIEDLEDTKIYDYFGDPGYFANYNGGNAMTVA